VAPGSGSRAEAWALLAPLLLFLVLILGFPFLANLVYSTLSFGFATLWQPVWTGLDNYGRALTSAAFGDSLLFSLRFAVIATVAQVGLGLAMALAFAPILMRHRWLMAFLLLPMMVSPALLGVMWRLLLNEFVGIVPGVLEQWGVFLNLLGADWVVWTLIMIEVLQWTPMAFLIIFTGLQAIPHELTEAALIDGANAWQRLSRITLPLLVPSILIAAAIRFIDGFRVFDHIFVLTGGGPGTLTTSASIHIYKSFFQAEELGTAIASAMLLFLASLLLLALAMRLTLKGSRP